MATTNRNKTPEGKLVNSYNWQGNTITNDAHILAAKNIHSPKRSDMFAVAWHRPTRCEVWFRNEEKFRAWKKMATDIDDYSIQMVTRKPKRGRPKNEK